jgi:hypothetical protein
MSQQKENDEWRPVTISDVHNLATSLGFKRRNMPTGEPQVLTMQYESKTKNTDLSVTYENCKPVEWEVIRPPKSWAVKSLMLVSKTLYSASEMVDRIMMRII